MIRGAARGLVSSLSLALSACSGPTTSLWSEAGGAASEPSAMPSAGAATSNGGSSATPTAGSSATAGALGASATTANGGTSSAGEANTQSAGSSATDPPARTRQKLEPAAGKTLLFIGQDTSEIESYANAFGMPAGVMLYSNVWDGLGVLSASDFGGYGQSDLGHWRGKSEAFAVQVGLDLDHGQNCGSCGGCTRAGYLEQLAQGDAARVAVVRAIITALRDSGRPVFLRVGYEFDAEICPGGFGKYPMAAYQQAFKRVRSIITEEHADKIALVWNAWAFQARDPGQAIGVAAWGWYPGDDVVDWIGLSVFPGASAGDVTEQYQADKRRQFVDFAKRHGKPLMIAEATPRARFQPAMGEAAWSGWYAGVFDYIAQNDVKAFCYINMNWEALGQWHGRGWGDSRVQGTALASKWQSALGNARFLQAGSGLYQELGP